VADDALGHTEEVPAALATSPTGLDLSFVSANTAIGTQSSSEEIINHFQQKYDVQVDLSPGKSITVTEAQTADKVLGKLPKTMVKNNSGFNELILDDNYHIDDYLPNGEPKPEGEREVYGVHYGQQVTLYKLARNFDRLGEFSSVGSAFTETLLHEVGESVWKKMPKEKRHEWGELVERTEFFEEINEANERFPIAFSLHWLDDPGVPPVLRNWVKGLE
jgi:hypothetical protein